MSRWIAISGFLSVATAFAATTTPTFYKDVLPVLQKNCQGCHRPGEAAPMSFLDYKTTRPWAKAIKNAVAVKKMPPWLADPHYGKFANDMTLSDKDREVILAWVDGGATEGLASQAPKPVKWLEGWNIGKPDQIFTMPAAFNVPAEGTIEYQYIVIPTNFTEDRWVKAAEVRPGSRPVVHHVIAFIRPKGSRWLADAQPGVPFVPSRDARKRPAVAGETARPVDPQESAAQLLQTELLVGFAPGMPATLCADGSAKLVPAGADLVFQMHYTSTGKAMSDQTSIGLVFAKEPPQRRDLTLSAANNRFAIPPGDPNYEVKSQITLRDDATLVSMMPHMHLRGKSFAYDVVYPSGEKETLLNIPKYDFGWQLVYVPAKPILLPKGTRVECTAHFDNSPNNKFNPDPRATVRFGDQTWDEMMIGWFNVTIPVGTDPLNLFRPRTASSD